MHRKYNFGDFDKVNKKFCYVTLDPSQVPQDFIDQFDRATRPDPTSVDHVAEHDSAKRALEDLRTKEVIEVDFREINQKYGRLAACVAWAAKRDGHKEEEEEQKEEEVSSNDSENNWIRVPSSLPISRIHSDRRTPSPTRDQLTMPVDLTTLVRSVPTFKEDYKSFEAYLNKLEAYFKICKVEEFTDKMALLEYSPNTANTRF